MENILWPLILLLAFAFQISFVFGGFYLVCKIVRWTLGSK
jgi:hypothetical protein